MDVGTRKVVADVVRRCREAGKDVSNTLVCFVVRTMQLQGKQLEERMSQQAFNEFADECAARLLVEDSPALETMRMQVAVEEASFTQHKAIEMSRRERDGRAAELEGDIVNASVEGAANEVQLLDKVYRNVFRYVAVASGMEIALNDMEVEAETFAALESVFPHHGLRRYLGLAPQEKSAQLKELASIVLGIRLFNRSIGKGGRRLEDVAPGYISQAVKMKEALQAELARVNRQLGQYAAVIAFKATSMRPSDPLLDRLKNEQTNRQAYASEVQKLIDYVAKGAATVNSLAGQFAEESAQVQQMVGSRTSVPKEKVYPRLDALGALHQTLVEERRVQVVTQRVADALSVFGTSFKSGLSNQMLHEASAGASVAAATPPMLEDSGPPKVEDTAAAAAAVGAEMMEGGVTMLEFKGFDVFALVKRNGIVIPSKPEAGSVSFNGKMYGFATAENAAQFSAAPEAFLAAAMDVVRTRPEIIHLAGLSAAFPTVEIAPIIEITSAPVSCDFGTQTPTHFVEKNIDKDYEWNEWALRRRALSLANLRQKKTHGAQSILSHFRRETETQVWLPKAAATQSASHKGTAMPQKKRYIGGLRGGPDVKMNIVSLELDVGQPHEY